jgi:hypothetical protein
MWEPFSCPVQTLDIAAINGWPKDHAELFVLGVDGTVWHRWWWLETRWSEWSLLADGHVRFPHARDVTAVSKRPGRMDVFVGLSDGGVQVFEYRDGQNWSRPYALST